MIRNDFETMCHEFRENAIERRYESVENCSVPRPFDVYNYSGQNMHISQQWVDLINFVNVALV